MWSCFISWQRGGSVGRSADVDASNPRTLQLRSSLLSAIIPNYAQLIETDVAIWLPRDEIHDWTVLSFFLFFFSLIKTSIISSIRSNVTSLLPVSFVFSNRKNFIEIITSANCNNLFRYMYRVEERELENLRYRVSKSSWRTNFSRRIWEIYVDKTISIGYWGKIFETCQFGLLTTEKKLAFDSRKINLLFESLFSLVDPLSRNNACFIGHRCKFRHSPGGINLSSDEKRKR